MQALIRKFTVHAGTALREHMGISTGKLVGLIMGPVLLAIVLNLPLGLTPEQQRLLALITGVMTYWITRALPIPVTSILALAMAAILNVAPARVVFSSISSPTLFLLIGGFIMTQSVAKYGLGKRIALRVLTIPGIAGSTYRIIVVFGALAALLSSVVDNGAVAAMLLPIGQGLIRTLDDDIREAAGMRGDDSRLRFGTALMLITAYGSTVGALMTPFGDGSVLVGWYFLQERFGLTIHVGTWMALAAPIVSVLFLMLCGLVLLLNRPEAHKLPHAARDIHRQRRELGPMSRGELNTAIAFTTAIGLWLLPPLVAFVTGYGSPVHEFVFSRLNPAAVAIISAVLLFVLPLDESRGGTLKWRDTRDMDWGPVLLMAAGLALATLMGKTGLAEVIGQNLSEELQGAGATGVYLFAATTAMLFSELTSNLVSISILVPIIPALADTGGGDAIIATLVATFAAIYGFMLPISTSANVVVYGSGKIPFLKMLKTGLLVDISGVLIVVAGVLLLTRILGIG